MDISLDWYRVFYNVVQEGMISKAADKLFITQPAVSQSIKLLEENLGITLLFRTSKGVKLTSDGEIIYRHIEKIFNEMELCNESINSIKGLHKGTLEIAASDTLCKHYLLPKLKTFQELYPNIKVHIYNKTTDEILLSLRAGEIDFGFINQPIPSNKGLTLTPIKRLQDCFICGKGLKKRLPSKITLEELTSHPLIVLEQGTNMRRFMDNYFQSHGVDYIPEMELGSIDLLTEFTKADFGISFVTSNFINKELDNKEVYILNIEEVIPPRSIALVELPRRPLSQAAERFKELVDQTSIEQ